MDNWIAILQVGTAALSFAAALMALAGKVFGRPGDLGRRGSGDGLVPRSRK